jgi:hypothetical protein
MSRNVCGCIFTLTCGLDPLLRRGILASQQFVGNQRLMGTTKNPQEALGGGRSAPSRLPPMEVVRRDFTPGLLGAQHR